MTKGYQIIEPCMPGRISLNLMQQVAVLHWLAQQLRHEFNNHLADMDIDVICVSRFGKYPALGIHAKGENPKNYGPLVESAVDRLLRETPITKILEIMDETDITKDEVWNKLQS